MIRKAIIVVLSAAGALAFGLLVASYTPWPDAWGIRPSENVEIVHAGTEWHFNLAPDSAQDLPKNIIVARGRLSVYHAVATNSEETPERPSAIRRLMFCGYGYSYGVRPRNAAYSPDGFRSIMIIHAPLHLLFLLFATYPTIAFIRGPLRRHRRRRNGQCLRCGYSLEGNVTGVCPECGVKV